MKFLICILVCVIVTNTTSAIDICADWNKIIDTLYILKNNTVREDKLTIQSTCPIPRPLADLQAAKNYAYGKLEGKQSCSLEEFASLLREKWDQPLWLMRYEGGVYNQTIATVAMVENKTWGVRVNFPERISGLKKSIAGDGYLTPDGKVEVRNTVENVTMRQLFNATA